VLNWLCCESAPTTAREGQVGSSWRLVGKGVLTFFIDLALLPLMFFFLPVRLLMLLLYTPLGLLQERSERKRSGVPAVDVASESSRRGLPEAGGLVGRLGWQRDRKYNGAFRTCRTLRRAGQHFRR